MILTQQESELFFRLYNALLDYTNERKRVTTMKAEYSDSERLEIRDVLFKDVSIIDRYVKNNPDSLSTEEIEILIEWKQAILGSFFLLRQLSKYAIFLSEDDKAYGVIALTTKVEYMVYALPAYITTVLLPFKGRIIYDGLMLTRSISFGGGMKKSLNRIYNEAKARHGVITSFATSDSVENEDDKDLKMMKFYLKSHANYDKYFDEILDLKYKNQRLKTAYYQSIGKLFAKEHKDRLKDAGIKKACFAVYNNILVGSAKTKQELKKTMKSIFPAKKLKYLYYFEVK